MGRKNLLFVVDDDLLSSLISLRGLRATDVANRKSKRLARLKPKYTADIKNLDLLITTLVAARKLLRALPKAVQ